MTHRHEPPPFPAAELQAHRESGATGPLILPTTAPTEQDRERLVRLLAGILVATCVRTVVDSETSASPIAA